MVERSILSESPCLRQNCFDYSELTMGEKMDTSNPRVNVQRLRVGVFDRVDSPKIGATVIAKIALSVSARARCVFCWYICSDARKEEVGRTE